jgi:hypothetical protein
LVGILGFALRGIDFLEKGAQISEPLAPEDAVVAHPVGQRREALGLRAIIDVATLGTLGDQAGLLQRVNSTTDISSELATRSKTARRVGSASARMTALMAVASIMRKQLAPTYSLVNTIV